jgi:hypothetical protein
MIKRPHTTAFVPAALLSGIILGCSSPSHIPSGSGYAPFEGDAGDVFEPTTDAGPREYLDVEVRSGDAMSTSFGPLTIEDVPDTPCVPSRAPAVQLSDGLATASGFDRVGQLGDRRFAFGSAGSVAITFGYEGDGPSMPILGPLVATAQNGDLEALLATADGLGLQVYDGQGKEKGTPIALEGAMATGPSLAAGPTTTLAIWCTPDDVAGQLYDQARAPGAAVLLSGASAGNQECRTATVWNGKNFTVAWTRRLHDGKTKTSVSYVDLDGSVSFVKVVVQSDGSHSLIDFVRASFGYVLFMIEDEQSGLPVAIRLDDFGNVLRPAVRIQGTREAFGVATFGDEFAISALIANGRAAMRPFDSAAKVLGPWVCLDDRPPSMPLAGRAALGTDDQGYAIVARMSDGSNWYMRTNHLGDDSPGAD